MKEFLNAIPQAATSPFALAAYAISALLFLFGGYRIRALGIAGKLLGDTQKTAIERILGPTPPAYTAAEYSKLKLQQSWFLLAAAVIIAVLVIVIVALAPNHQK